MKRYEPLEGYELSGCAVRTRNIISFWGQKWDNADPLDIRPTRVFFFYADEPEGERWAFREPAETRGFRGCAVAIPEDRWVFVADDGPVYVVGAGVDAFEEPISAKPFFFFSNVKRVAGRAIAVGPRRKVFVRESPDKWQQLDAGLFPQGDQTNHDSSGFSDIDGFSDSELYACGGRGDLWRFDGHLWIQIEIPTNDKLWRLCCASDGLVHVITLGGQILMGRDQNWNVVSQDLTDQSFESIVVFNDKVLISTQSALFEMAGNVVQPASLGSMPPMQSRSFLAARDGILVVAGSRDACSYDGTQWSVIIPSAT